jgi:hypothetical protein
VKEIFVVIVILICPISCSKKDSKVEKQKLQKTSKIVTKKKQITIKKMKKKKAIKKEIIKKTVKFKVRKIKSEKSNALEIKYKINCWIKLKDGSCIDIKTKDKKIIIYKYSKKGKLLKKKIIKTRRTILDDNGVMLKQLLNKQLIITFSTKFYDYYNKYKIISLSSDLDIKCKPQKLIPGKFPSGTVDTSAHIENYLIQGEKTGLILFFYNHENIKFSEFSTKSCKIIKSGKLDKNYKFNFPKQKNDVLLTAIHYSGFNDVIYKNNIPFIKVFSKKNKWRKWGNQTILNLETKKIINIFGKQLKTKLLEIEKKEIKKIDEFKKKIVLYNLGFYKFILTPANNIFMFFNIVIADKNGYYTRVGMFGREFKENGKPIGKLFVFDEYSKKYGAKYYRDRHILIGFNNSDFIKTYPDGSWE